MDTSYNNEQVHSIELVSRSAHVQVSDHVSDTSTHYKEQAPSMSMVDYRARSQSAGNSHVSYNAPPSLSNVAARDASYTVVTTIVVLVDAYGKRLWADAYGLCRKTTMGGRLWAFSGIGGRLWALSENDYGRPPLWTRGSLLFVRIRRRSDPMDLADWKSTYPIPTNISSALVTLTLPEPNSAKEMHSLTTSMPFDASTLDKSVPPGYLKFIMNLENEILNTSMEKEALKIEVMRAQAMIDILQLRIGHLTEENCALRKGV
ncbi:hypothetical protein QVD17_16169 [Tagetes erecta]|uniref:Uncharacterized protein n=1 Tax=Tagetes erecta TaxID=13708 RepID=A0AAD8KR83_TARER|nr:hypothetical protein QVD17_16169 [Tagetes erecta]